MEIKPGMSIDALVKGLGHCGFGARRLAEAVDIYEKMLSGNFTKFLTLSGAMVPAGMRNVVSELIRNGYVDVLVITGANLVHDIIESFGCHCLGSSESDDAGLRAQGISRIYDVFLRDEDFVAFEELMQRILPEGSETLSGRELMSHLGRQINDERSILRSAYQMKVPVFCPALPDSMIGLQAWMFSQTKRLYSRCLCRHQGDRGHLLWKRKVRNSNSGWRRAQELCSAVDARHPQKLRPRDPAHYGYTREWRPVRRYPLRGHLLGQNIRKSELCDGLWRRNNNSTYDGGGDDGEAGEKQD